MSHPDPCFDPDNSYEDDMYDIDANYDDYNDFNDLPPEPPEDNFWNDNYDDSMDGDHDSAMSSCGWGTDEDYGYYGDDDREDFHSDDGYGSYED
jgi:hypothetical protein